MQKLSQRNPAWSGIKLGTSTTTTIGSHGCTITSVAMLAGLTPDQVNERLKKVGGYANTNLIVWTKIQEAIPWLQFEWRGYAYENNRVAAAITKNGGCLVAVDGTKIGGNSKDGHWVLYIGNQTMIDPWDGQEKPTTHYPATGYAIINRVGNPPASDSEKTIPVEVDTFEKLVRNSGEWGKTVGEYLPDTDPDSKRFEDVRAVVSGYKSRATDLEKQRDEAVQKTNVALTEVSNQKDKLANIEASCQRETSLLRAEISALSGTAKALEKLRGEYIGTVASLEEQLRAAQKAKGIADTAKTELETKLDQCQKGQATGEQVSALVRILQAIFGKR